jgi:hypothetical protein
MISAEIGSAAERKMKEKKRQQTVVLMIAFLQIE